MSYSLFLEKFKELYFEERRQQELRGVVAMYSQNMCEKFSQTYSVNRHLVDKYFQQLKTNQVIYAVVDWKVELFQWVE